MPYYMCAIPVTSLRRFPRWTEIEERSECRDDDAALYLDESLTLRREPLGEVVVTGDDPDWRVFCREVLKFSVPDWEAEGEAVRLLVLDTEDSGS